MPLATFVAGRYSATLASIDLGIAESGYELSMEPKHQLINKSDAFGDTLLDTVLRGVDWSLQSDQLEYKAGPISAIGQIAALGTLGVIGRLGSSVAGALVLTSTAGTPAAAAPATLTAAGAMLAPNANPRLLFNSELRKVPIRFVFLPYDSGGGVIKFFVQA